MLGVNENDCDVLVSFFNSVIEICVGIIVVFDIKKSVVILVAVPFPVLFNVIKKL